MKVYLLVSWPYDEPELLGVYRSERQAQRVIQQECDEYAQRLGQPSAPVEWEPTTLRLAGDSKTVSFVCDNLVGKWTLEAVELMEDVP